MRTALALALAGLTVATSAAGQESVTLKWTLKEGDTFYAKSVADMDLSMTVAGMDIDLKMKVSSVQRFKVLAAKPGATTVEMTMQDMKMEMEGLPGGVPGLGDIGDRIKGATITATLDDDMQVTKVQGYDKFLDKLAGDDEAVRKQMKGQFSEAAVGQMVSQVFSFAPKKAVKVGDTWTRTDKMPTGVGDAAVKQTFKLAGVENGVAKIGVTADMTFKAADAGFPGLPPGVKVSKFDMKADKIAGTVLFDAKAGRLKETKQDMNLNGAITMSANGMDIEMTMKIKGVQTTTVTDKNPVVD
jgi:hypothetical protein